MTEITNTQVVQQTIAERRAAAKQKIVDEVTRQYSGCASDNLTTQLKDDIERQRNALKLAEEVVTTIEDKLKVMQTLLHQALSPLQVGSRAFFRHKPVIITGVSVLLNGDVIYAYRQILKGDKPSTVVKHAPWHAAHEMRTPADEQALQERRQKKYEEQRLAKAAATLPEA